MSRGVKLKIRGRLLRVEAIVMSENIESVNIIVGINVIRRLGGVTIYENGAVEFRGAHCAISTQPMTDRSCGPSPCKIKDRRRRREPSLTEIEHWIEEGILAPWDEDVRTGVLLLIAVVQPTKNKVRPVLDNQELNKYITCHFGGDAIAVSRASTCCKTFMEVPVGQIQGANLLPDSVGVWIKYRQFSKP